MDEHPKLNEIRERDLKQYTTMGGPDLQCHADRHFLLAEIIRLDAQIVERDKWIAHVEAALGAAVKGKIHLS